jgi:hypothetical protein
MVSLLLSLSGFYFAGLWQLIFAREKNFVNLTWDCYLGNPIKKHSLKKVV